MAKKRRLGKGLDALLGPDKSVGQSPAPEAVAETDGLRELPLEQLKPGKYQPRTRFDKEPLEELAESIRASGVMQPIVVRPVSKQGSSAAVKWEIIAGERRWRAAQLVGLDKIPAVIRDVGDEQTIAMSLIENLQREDLNPIEEARALERLIEEFEFTHQQIADAVGKSRSAVTNILRLMQLSAPVAELLTQGALEAGHARALLPLESNMQTHLAHKVVAEGLNVRQTEALVRKQGEKPRMAARKPTQDADTQRLEGNLTRTLGQPVKIQHTKAGKGKMIINYASLDELDGILAKMGYRED